MRIVDNISYEEIIKSNNFPNLKSRVVLGNITVPTIDENGETNKQEIFNGEKLEVSGFVIKPINQEKIKNIIQKILFYLKYP